MTRMLMCAALAAMMAASAAEAGVPDPSRSGCGFPTALPCPDPVTVNVTLRDAFDAPVVACLTEARIILDAGTLGGAQVTTVAGSTDANGIVALTFDDGILGTGTIHFEVHALCIGDIMMCESGLLTVHCGTIAVEATSWGRVKSLYD